MVSDTEKDKLSINALTKISKVLKKKKVGNACRTKNQISNSKSKGRVFERDCEASLKQVWSDCYMTHEKGYIQQYDLQTDAGKVMFECKRLKGISWNQLVKLHKKLVSVAPKGYSSIVLFKSNMQPCLVFNGVSILKFETIFEQPFIKHTPTRRKKE